MQIAKNTFGHPAAQPLRFDFYREIFAALADGVVVVDARGRCLEVNDAFCRMVGFTRDELLGLDPPYPFWPPEELSRLEPAFAAALAGEPADLQLLLCKKSGQRFPAFVHPARIRGPEGSDSYFAAVIKDASEHTRMERALQRSEERWRSIVENPHDYVAIFGRDYRYLYANHSAPGFDVQALIGKATPFEMVDPRHHEQMRSAFDRTFGEGVVTTYDCFVPHNQRWYFNVVTPLKEDGRVTAVSVLTRDITEQKRAVEELRQNERRLALALAAGDFGTFECDLGMGAWLFSPRVHEILGYPLNSQDMPRDLVGLLAQVHPDDAPQLREALVSHLQTGTQAREQFRIRRASGEYVWVEVRARSFSEPDGSARLHGLVADISAQKRSEHEHERMEMQLRHTQKMETLGTLAGGIAHDFNNILMPILGNAELLQLRLGSDAQLRALSDSIVKAALRAQEMVARILVFGRPGDEQRERVRIPELAREALRLLSTSLPHSITVRTHIEESCCDVWGSPGQIHQAILNVCTNAYQALRTSGGLLELSVEGVIVDEAQHLAYGVPTGSGVRVSIRDSGPGIPHELQERIFEPFFTTKRVGEGTGLGLSLVHSIMKRHGGAVVVDSQPGKGARFDLYFPASELVEAAGAGPAREPPRVSERSLRILCLDDDAAVLAALEAMLVHTGHQVSTAASPRDALAMLRMDSSAFDLIVTDYTMPQLTGLEFAKEALRIRPDLPIILISGYAEIAGLESLPENIRSVLMKPMTLQAFFDAVRSASV